MAVGDEDNNSSWPLLVPHRVLQDNPYQQTDPKNQPTCQRRGQLQVSTSPYPVHISPNPFELLMSSTPSTADGYQCGRCWVQLMALQCLKFPICLCISAALAETAAIPVLLPQAVHEQSRSAALCHHLSHFWAEHGTETHTQEQGHGWEAGGAGGSHAPRNSGALHVLQLLRIYNIAAGFAVLQWDLHYSHRQRPSLGHPCGPIPP